MKITAILFAMLFSVIANAETKTWIGDVDSDWSDPLNWSDNTLPVNDDDIIIDADDYTTAPIMSANSPFIIDDLTIRDSGVFTITGGSLTVGDDIVIDDATFTVSGGTLSLDEAKASNNATVNFTGGTITMDGDLDGNSGATFNISTTVTQTDGDEDLEVGTDVTFNISAGANITGFDDVDFDTGGGNGTFNMTGGTLVIDDDFKIQDGDDNVVSISGGTLDVGDDFEMETDNNQITFNGTADVDFGGEFEFGASGGGTGNDATNSTVTIGGSATLDVVGDINFYEGGSGLTSFLVVESGGAVTAGDVDDADSVTVEEGGSVMSGGSPLPVELLKFEGDYKNNQVILNWSTASELNNDRFEILRSRDGITFEKIGEVMGNGTTNELVEYQFIDRHPQNHESYYRLLQIDFDGTNEYLPITFVRNEKFDLSDVSVFPNPSTNGFIKIQNSGFIHDGVSVVSLTDIYGRKVFSKKYDSFQNEVIDGLSQLNSGTYILTILNNGRVLQKRIKLNY